MTLTSILITAAALYLLAALAIAFTGDWLRARGHDLDLSAYGAAVLALLAFLASAAGPTLDNIHAQDGRNHKTAFAAKE